MKKTFILLIILLLHFSANVSHSAQYWVKTYGEESHRHNDMARVIQNTSDGGYIVGGSTRSSDAESNAVVLKIDNIGAVSWQKIYGGEYDDYVTSIQQTIDDGFVVLGSGRGIWVQKLDNSGNVIWQNAYYGEVAYSIQQTTDEGYILVGAVNFNHGVIIKLDSEGNVIWRKIYQGAVWTSFVQTADGGYIVIGEWDDIFDSANRDDFFIAKLDQNGDITWQRKYVRSNNFIPRSIQQTKDGEYIISGYIFTNYQPSDLFVLKMDSDGTILWQKIYDGGWDEWGAFIQQTTDGGYIVVTRSKGAWLIKLDNNGNVMWQKAYDILNVDFRPAIPVQQTTDDGYILAGFSWVEAELSYNIGVLKLDSNGEIPNCEISEIRDVIVTDTNCQEEESTIVVITSNRNFAEKTFTAQGTLPELGAVCCYDDDDYDCDNIPNANDNCPELANPEQLDLDNDGIGSECDNCPNDPEDDLDNDNICGDIDICPNDPENDIDGDSICGDVDTCPNFPSTNQEDTYPPQGNGIGNPCDCESDFDCDGDVDGSDATTFKLYFGRNPLFYPCDEINPCRGDFDCDGDSDGKDAGLYKEDFGRNVFNNPCPACVVEEWCSYP